MLYEGEALPHFNEVDECAGLDGLITYRVVAQARLRAGEHAARSCATAKTTTASSSGCSRSPAPRRRNTSSAAMPARSSERQPPMYFPLGGGTLKGISKPGEIVWSRIFVDRRKA